LDRTFRRFWKVFPGGCLGDRCGLICRRSRSRFGTLRCTFSGLIVAGWGWRCRCWMRVEKGMEITDSFCSCHLVGWFTTEKAWRTG
jgi:hypothetical protein